MRRCFALTCLLLGICLLSGVNGSFIRTSCPGGDDWYYFNGNCYFWSNRTEGWFGAEKHCQQLGGHLASIGSRSENNFLQALAQCSTQFWIGMAKTNARQRGFTWWDNTPANYTEQLSIRTTDYCDCVFQDPQANGRWLNHYCQMLLNYVCLVPLPPTRDQPQELPAKANLDAGRDDAKKTCPADWLALEGNCYFVSSEKANYFNAQLSCEAKGAIVASVLSPREQVLITMALGCSTEAWIGLEKVKPCLANPSQQSCWIWLDRTPLSFTAWTPGNPHSPSVKEVECVITDGQWRSTNCYNEYKYICKKK